MTWHLHVMVQDNIVDIQEALGSSGVSWALVFARIVGQCLYNQQAAFVIHQELVVLTRVCALPAARLSKEAFSAFITRPGAQASASASWPPSRVTVHQHCLCSCGLPFASYQAHGYRCKDDVLP